MTTNTSRSAEPQSNLNNSLNHSDDTSLIPSTLDPASVGPNLYTGLCLPVPTSSGVYYENPSGDTEKRITSTTSSVTSNGTITPTTITSKHPESLTLGTTSPSQSDISLISLHSPVVASSSPGQSPLTPMGTDTDFTYPLSSHSNSTTGMTSHWNNQNLPQEATLSPSQRLQQPINTHRQVSSSPVTSLGSPSIQPSAINIHRQASSSPVIFHGSPSIQPSSITTQQQVSSSPATSLGSPSMRPLRPDPQNQMSVQNEALRHQSLMNQTQQIYQRNTERLTELAQSINRLVEYGSACDEFLNWLQDHRAYNKPNEEPLMQCAASVYRSAPEFGPWTGLKILDIINKNSHRLNPQNQGKIRTWYHDMLVQQDLMPQSPSSNSSIVANIPNSPLDLTTNRLSISTSDSRTSLPSLPLSTDSITNNDSIITSTSSASTAPTPPQQGLVQQHQQSDQQRYQTSQQYSHQQGSQPIRQYQHQQQHQHSRQQPQKSHQNSQYSRQYHQNQLPHQRYQQSRQQLPSTQSYQQVQQGNIPVHQQQQRGQAQSQVVTSQHGNDAYQQWPSHMIPFQLMPHQQTSFQHQLALYQQGALQQQFILPQQAAPQQVTPRQLAPQQVIPRQLAPQQLTPQQVMPQQVMAQQMPQLQPPQLQPAQQQHVHTPTGQDHIAQSSKALVPGITPLLYAYRAQYAVVPFRLEHNAAKTLVTFNISNDEYRQLTILPSDSTDDGTPQTFVKYYLQAWKVKTPESKCEWPETVSFLINNKALVLEKRRKLPTGQGESVRYVGKDRPCDLRNFLLRGSNVLAVKQGQCACNYSFAIGIYHCKTESTITNEIETSTLDKTFGEGLVDKLLGNNDSKLSVVTDDDIEVIQESVRLNLKCPISLTMIKIPVKGVDCRHPDCFDLHSFILVNPDILTTWKCPFCNLYTPPSSLRRDLFFQNILLSAPKNAYEITISGSSNNWRVTKADSIDDLEDADDDYDCDTKVAKPDHMCGSSITIQAATEPDNVISLLSDSEEEEDEMTSGNNEAEENGRADSNNEMEEGELLDKDNEQQPSELSVTEGNTTGRVNGKENGHRSDSDFGDDDQGNNNRHKRNRTDTPSTSALSSNSDTAEDQYQVTEDTPLQWVAHLQSLRQPYP